MKAKIYIGAKKYALYIGRKIVQKTLEFLSLPARFVSKKVQELKNYTIYGQSVQTSARTKNLFDPAILAQGNYTSDITTRVCAKLDLKNNTDYTISITGDYEMFVGWFNKGTKTNAGNLGTWFFNNVTISSNNIDTDLYDYVLIIRNYAHNTLLLQNFDGNIQLEEGTQATPFVPYIATTPTPDTPIPVESVGNLGKNLFNKNATIIKSYIESSVNRFTPSSPANSVIIKIKPNTTYTLHSEIKDGTRLRCGLADTYFTQGDVRIVSRASTYNSITFTTNETEQYCYINILDGNNIQYILDALQLEEGSTATPYEPYGYQIPVVVGNTITNIYLNEPLRKIGEYADYIDFENQKVVRNIGNKQLGSLTWSASSGGLGRFWSDGVKENVNIELPCFSNIFVGIGIGGYTENSIGYERGTNKGRMYVGYKLDVSTKDDFVNMLNNTNAYIYYPFATPTEESITLPEIGLQQGTLMLDISTDIKSSKMIITGDIDNE